MRSFRSRRYATPPPPEDSHAPSDLEYSANLQDTGDFGTLCQQLAQTLIAQQADGKAVYPIGGVRVRALAALDYCIADGRPDAAFVHATLKIGAGRSNDTKSVPVTPCSRS